MHYDVIATFSLIFRNSEFLMKIKFPSYVLKNFTLLNNNKTRKFEFRQKFGVTSLKESFEYLRKVLWKQL